MQILLTGTLLLKKISNVEQSKLRRYTTPSRYLTRKVVLQTQFFGALSILSILLTTIAMKTKQTVSDPTESWENEMTDITVKQSRTHELT